MLYRTVVPIQHKGERVERNTEVEMDPKEAANLGGDVVPVEGDIEAVEEVVEEKALDEMTKGELEAKAEELGLAKSGSKADLIERITLFVEGGGEETEEEVEE